MKSIANQYRDLTEGRMSQQNFMRNLRMTMPQYVTNVTSFGDAVKILKNKSIIVESAIKENFDFNKAAIESATGDKISHTEEDDFGETIYWSTKNPNVTYYIGSDEQIIKYDGETGERYVIGDLRNYDEPSNDDYEPDTDADYEEPRDDFDMAGGYNDGEFWEGKGEGDEDEIDAMVKKMEDEKAGEEEVKSQYDLGEELNEFEGGSDTPDNPKLQAAVKYLVQNRDKFITPDYFTSQGIRLLSSKSDEELYDYVINSWHPYGIYDTVADMKSKMEEPLNEAVGNFELKKLARELYSVIKRVNGVTSVKIVTSDIKNAASAFQVASKKGNTYAEDAVMAEIFVNEAASFISVILSGSSRFLNPVAGEVNKQLQAFVGKNYAGQLDAQYVKAPNDNTMLGINIKFLVNPAGVKESKELNEAKKKEDKVEYNKQQANPTELRLGIRTELEHGDMELDKAKEIAYKNIAKDPIYYTKLKLSGAEAHPKKVKDEKEAPAKKKKETIQLVDLVNGMQKVKMPKKEEKKKLKEASFNVIGEPNEVAKQVMQFVDGNATLKALSDDIQIQQTSDPNEALLRFQYWDALPGEAIEKLKLQFDVQPDSDFDEDTGNIIFYRLTPLRRNYGSKDLGASFEKFKSSLEEIVHEVMNEYYDGRDNLIDPLAAAEENN